MRPSIFEAWSEKAADNAISLAEESRLLFDARCLPRAYYLAHMSAEESAKSILLYGIASSGTPESELPKISRLLQNHKKKIAFLVNYAATLSGEAREKIGGLGESLIDHINSLKNDTMYVSYAAKSVLTPAEKVAGIEIELHLKLAENLSQHAKSLFRPTIG